MIRPLLYLALIFFVAEIQAQVPVLDPSMTITEFGIVDSPFGEEVDKIIDGTSATKFLDFELADGMGFTVDTGFTSNVISIDLTTANDFEVRDPIDFEVLGSTDGTTFTSIATGTVECIFDRFFTRNFEFPNSEFYSIYRVNFSAPCDPSGGTGIPSIQLAEIQLYEPELSINSNVLKRNDITIYPNPANRFVHIQIANSQMVNTIELVDMLGNQLKKIEIASSSNEQQLELDDLSSGVYFVRIHGDDNSITKKLVIR